jgi:hypothetical protein
MSFLSQFPELQAKGNTSSVSLFSPKSPKTILIMPTPKPTNDEAKREQLRKNLTTMNSLYRKDCKLLPTKKLNLKPPKKNSKKRNKRLKMLPALPLD